MRENGLNRKDGARSRSGRSAAALCTFAVAAQLLACAGAPPPPPPDPGPAFDRQQAVASLVRRTAISAPTRIIFNWRARELGGARGDGQGVAQIEPPYKARLDMFEDNGELVLVAALVDGELRIPPGVDERLAPPPHLLWALLGVFRQGGNLAVTSGSEDPGGVTTMRMRTASGDDLLVRATDGRLTLMERLSGGQAVQRVQIEPGTDARFPRSATYHDLAETIELEVEATSITTVDQFPPDTWNPGGLPAGPTAGPSGG